MSGYESVNMKALIAMSGGVDSSVAAWLTRQAGYECIGVTMKLFDNADAGISSAKTCCSLTDIQDAYSVALHLGITHHVCNFTQQFREQVIVPFAESYARGLTPNPCIACNRYMKFELLQEYAWQLGCEAVVTGHYARIIHDEKGWHLYKALDPEKDQSYVLYNLTQETLPHTLFPLGGMNKSQTRETARQLGLVTARKHDSQDICFAPDGDYARVAALYGSQNSRPGNFTDEEGNVLGTHKGIIHYTIGQRRGLGLSSKERLYVRSIDPDNNTVVLGDDRSLFSKELIAWDFNWISGSPPEGKLKCSAKIRYRHKEQSARAEVLADGLVHVVFDDLQRAITPGQSVVLYNGDEVLGGGIIQRR